MPGAAVTLPKYLLTDERGQRLYTMREAAAYLGITGQAVNQACQEKRLVGQWYAPTAGRQRWFLIRKEALTLYEHRVRRRNVREADRRWGA